MHTYICIFKNKGCIYEHTTNLRNRTFPFTSVTLLVPFHPILLIHSHFHSSNQTVIECKHEPGTLLGFWETSVSKTNKNPYPCVTFWQRMTDNKHIQKANYTIYWKMLGDRCYFLLQRFFWFGPFFKSLLGFLSGPVVNNPPANAGDTGMP